MRSRIKRIPWPVVLVGLGAIAVLASWYQPVASNISHVVCNHLLDFQQGSSKILAERINLGNGGLSGNHDTYFKMSPETGYVFEKIEIIPQLRWGAVSCTLQVWPAAADSTTTETVLADYGETNVIPIDMPGSASYPTYRYFGLDVHCAAFSLRGLTSTYDMLIVGHQKKGAL
jgi:hypothetical protein